MSLTANSISQLSCTPRKASHKISCAEAIHREEEEEEGFYRLLLAAVVLQDRTCCQAAEVVRDSTNVSKINNASVCALGDTRYSPDETDTGC